jgi:hypothetical protein
MSIRCGPAQAGYVITRKRKGVGTVRLLVTGGTGVLGRAFLPLAEAEGHVCRDGERASNRRFAEATGWRPRH